MQVFGTGRLEFDGRTTVIAADNAFPTIRKGETVTINLATSAGFEQGIIDIRTRRGGLGLVGMRERAVLIQGTLEVESRVGRGTTIFLRVPNAAQKEKVLRPPSFR